MNNNNNKNLNNNQKILNFHIIALYITTEVYKWFLSFQNFHKKILQFTFHMFCIYIL